MSRRRIAIKVGDQTTLLTIPQLELLDEAHCAIGRPIRCDSRARVAVAVRLVGMGLLEPTAWHYFTTTEQGRRTATAYRRDGGS